MKNKKGKKIATGLASIFLFFGKNVYATSGEASSSGGTVGIAIGAALILGVLALGYKMDKNEENGPKEPKIKKEKKSKNKEKITPELEDEDSNNIEDIYNTYNSNEEVDTPYEVEENENYVPETVETKDLSENTEYEDDEEESLFSSTNDVSNFNFSSDEEVKDFSSNEDVNNFSLNEEVKEFSLNEEVNEFSSDEKIKDFSSNDTVEEIPLNSKITDFSENNIEETEANLSIEAEIDALDDDNDTNYNNFTFNNNSTPEFLMNDLDSKIDELDDLDEDYINEKVSEFQKNLESVENPANFLNDLKKYENDVSEFEDFSTASNEDEDLDSFTTTEDVVKQKKYTRKKDKNINENIVQEVENVEQEEVNNLDNDFSFTTSDDEVDDFSFSSDNEEKVIDEILEETEEPSLDIGFLNQMEQNLLKNKEERQSKNKKN